jgi:hypothetical protein
MGVSCEPPLRALVHDTCEVFNSHLCGSVSHGRVGLGLLLLGVFVRLRRESLGGGLCLVSLLCLVCRL